MPQILYEDYVNKRIYLHPDTVIIGFDPALMQREHRNRRFLNANGERRFSQMVSFRGNESKGGGKFFPKTTILASGVRIVPYDAAHNLKIKNEIACIADGVSNQACFDRIDVLSNVDIDVDYSPIEIVTVSTGSAVTQEDIDEIVGRTTISTQTIVSTTDVGIKQTSKEDIAELSRDVLLGTTTFPVI